MNEAMSDELDHREVNEPGWSYQLAFLTPGISPLRAKLRKQMRQMPNLR
jgi:hypothetical protein